MISNYLKAGLICLCALGISNNSVAQTSGTPIKNIVLVHGAWADGSGWKGVYDILVKGGFKPEHGAVQSRIGEAGIPCFGTPYALIGQTAGEALVSIVGLSRDLDRC